ncbi:MAG: type IX secretion system protein PorQ [Bacteroidetes bacterium]|nr:type IX secretion system protein PorQ [Bacteroidota bacterium]
MKYIFSALFVLILSSGISKAQQSGRVFEFLSLPPTAKVASLGGLASPDLDLDPGMALLFSSQLDSLMHNHVSLNFTDHVSDIHYGNVSYIRDYSRVGTFAAIINYISYGNIMETDEFGWDMGEFSPLELSLGVAWGKKLADYLSIGSQIKFISSSFHSYNATGLAADISLSYRNPEHNFLISAMVRNAGRQITYYHGTSEPLPLDVMIGFSKKLNNAPLRFSIVANNLHRYDLKFKEQKPQFPSDVEETPETTADRILDIGDNLLRHLTIGLEILPVKNFNLRVGYNYRRRQELGHEGRMSTVGISWGIGVRISKFEFNYGRSHFHLAGSQNHISIGTNIDRFKSNRRTPDQGLSNF